MRPRFAQSVAKPARATPSAPPQESHHNISWLALFYDLILVAVVSRATYIYGKNPTWETLAFVGLNMLVIFVLWALTTLTMLSSQKESWLQRALVFIQVCALLVAALAMYRGGGISDRWAFVSLGVSFLAIAMMQLTLNGSRMWAQRNRPLVKLSLVSAILFGFGALFPMGFELSNGLLIAWINYPIAVACASIGTFIVAPRILFSTAPIDSRILNERFGVLLLIVLGDAFLHLIHELGTVRALPQPLSLVLVLVFVLSVWLLYFPTISEPAQAATVAQARSRFIAHFILIASTAFSIVAYVDLAASQIPGKETSHWSVLPVVGLLASIAWLTIPHDGSWSIAVRIHLVAAIAVAVVGVLTSVLSVLTWERGLVIAAALTLADAIVVIQVRRSQGQKLDHDSPGV